MRANGEEGKGLGRFWQGRYKAVRILDEESLLAFAAYIDLNPIRADVAETLEQSDYTSVQRRVQAIKTVPVVVGSSGALSPVLERLGIEPTLWSAMVKDFGRAFMNVAGTAKSVSEARSLKTHRKFYLART